MEADHLGRDADVGRQHLREGGSAAGTESVEGVRMCCGACACACV